ncbi:MAG: nucleoside deaminase [Pyrinomonadaceae bacterium]|nr:nucleoside deaminase [Pyrinomonadaceae bacterium]
MKIEERFLRHAIELSASARARGNHPFGALLSIESEIVLTAENTVNTERNPTAHAETNLIQEAVRKLKPEELARATLYTSCEPCAMCTGAIYWSGVRRVVYALSSTDLARLAGGDFLIPCRELFARALQPVEVAGPLLTEEALKPHEGYWKNLTGWTG